MKSDIDSVVHALEQQFFTLEQLQRVPVQDNREALVDLSVLDSSLLLVPRPGSLPFMGPTIWVREAVAAKLSRIQAVLALSGLGLKITDGWRPRELQERYWRWHLARTSQTYPEFSPTEAEAYTIRFAAHPEVAYHPTGGAVDLTIIELASGHELDMGTPVDEFTHEAYAHWPLLSAVALANRNRLFTLMTGQDFYNFPSEWWHFNYGTRDWALHIGAPAAIYGEIALTR